MTSFRFYGPRRPSEPRLLFAPRAIAVSDGVGGDNFLIFARRPLSFTYHSVGIDGHRLDINSTHRAACIAQRQSRRGPEGGWAQQVPRPLRIAIPGQLASPNLRHGKHVRWWSPAVDRAESGAYAGSASADQPQLPLWRALLVVLCGVARDDTGSRT